MRCPEHDAGDYGKRRVRETPQQVVDRIRRFRADIIRRVDDPEITTTAQIDFQHVVRKAIADAGYTDASCGFDAKTCGVIISVKEQSKDIAQGVNAALETKVGRESDAIANAVAQ